jgi:hypothetical protein
VFTRDFQRSRANLVADVSRSQGANSPGPQGWSLQLIECEVDLDDVTRGSPRNPAADSSVALQTLQLLIHLTRSRDAGSWY